MAFAPAIGETEFYPAQLQPSAWGDLIDVSLLKSNSVATMTGLQQCLDLSFRSLLRHGCLRFGSRLFSEWCQYVEAQGHEMTADWTHLYHEAWSWFESRRKPAATFTGGYKFVYPAELALHATGFISHDSIEAFTNGVALVNPGACVYPEPVRGANWRLTRKLDTFGRRQFGLQLPPAEDIDGRQTFSAEFRYDIGTGY